MKVIQICPACGTVGVKVKGYTVKHMLKNYTKESQFINKKWFSCLKSECEIAYFSDNVRYRTDDIKVSLWYKDCGSEVPICYCSELTRSEIINAVQNGCKTIDEVQEYTGKNTTGKCREKNPLGKCCKNVFLKTIEKAKNS